MKEIVFSLFVDIILLFVLFHYLSRYSMQESKFLWKATSIL